MHSGLKYTQAQITIFVMNEMLCFHLFIFLSNRHIIDERQYKYNLIESAETR